MLKRVLLFLTACFLTSCTPTLRQTLYPDKDNAVFLQRGQLVFSEEEERFLQEEARQFQIEVPDREEIRKYIRYFLSNKRFTQYALRRANYYMPLIKPVLENHGLPPELALLPAIESGFNPFAVSRSGAAGLWQFMPQTARRYGLRVDHIVDERYDIQKSTEAAARYLKDLYSFFKNWELALAAYNCGERCVFSRTGGVDFWQTKEFLPLETRNYVPAFMALLLLARFPDKYGLDISVDSISVVKKRVEEDTSVKDLITEAQIQKGVFYDLNPHIKTDKIPAGVYVYLPANPEEERKVIRWNNGAKFIVR